MRNLENLIKKTQLQFQLNALLKGLSIGIGMVFLYLTIFQGIGLAVVVGILSTMLFAVYFGMLKQDREKAINTLHLHYPELEYSLDILDKENKNVADLLQLKRLESQFRSKKVPLVFGQSVLPAFLFMLVSTGIFGMSLMDLNLKSEKVSPSNSVPTTFQTIAEIEEVLLQSVKVEIQPPSYTGQKTISQQELDIKALEGSRMTWTIDFNSGNIDKVVLQNGFGLEVPMEKNAKGFQIIDRLENSGIYAIKASNDGEVVFQSDFHKLELSRDKAPLILPEEKDLYKYYFHKDPRQLNVKAKVSDDFLVRKVYLIATLARGSGENVKFRESKFSLDKNNFQSAELTHAMDLTALDFQPGDELYYYWLAIDNKLPETNISKSDTYFIQFVDSTGMSDSQLESMAIHVLPEYFRSQRQIIIDTEKLLASKKDIAERKFNEDSNELGFEQKLLRMRYGQYLGEEFESNAPGGTLNTAEGRNILESFIHNHDQEGENEGGPALSKFRYAALQKYQEEHEKNQEILKQQVGELAGAGEHDHADHEHDEDDELSNLLEDYLHNHDSEEMNTLYEQSTRSMLKMALEMMWQSELHLRLFEPEQALPYQHKALEYLKSVQQKSRVYVKKSGFDPPPIKEAEKRLTGESKDLKTLYARELTVSQAEIPMLASRILGMLNQVQITVDGQKVIQHFRQLWTERISSSGMEDWNTLLLLQKLAASEMEEDEKVLLTNKLQSLLDRERRNNPNALSNQKLAKAFWENLR
ncbi:hypothetical protein [Aquiflexum lacus]|uniref:hypothetical protein n=1 Tax=Aquiflexum lacus TaxID=2483805 RepID=UPI0018947268|nr:hypothetical protein [Aquiflexum lacus]